MDLALGLYYAGNYSDTVRGRQQYLQYLAWLKSDHKANRSIQSSKLCRGWALGHRQFKEQLIDKFLPVGQIRHLEGKNLKEANEIRWQQILTKCLSVMEKDKTDITADRKSAEWKGLIALFMKDHTSASNVWLTQQLNMGIPQGVSRTTRLLPTNQGQKNKKYKEMRRITA